MLKESDDPRGTVLVTVACPECHNLNRRARRACGNCNRTGKVQKWIPKSSIVEREEK